MKIARRWTGLLLALVLLVFAAGKTAQAAETDQSDAAQELVLGEYVSVVLSGQGDTLEYSFTPTQNGCYTLSGSGTREQAAAAVLDEQGNALQVYQEDGTYAGFGIYILEAGKTYCIRLTQTAAANAEFDLAVHASAVPTSFAWTQSSVLIRAVDAQTWELTYSSDAFTGLTVESSNEAVAKCTGWDESSVFLTLGTYGTADITITSTDGQTAVCTLDYRCGGAIGSYDYWELDQETGLLTIDAQQTTVNYQPAAENCAPWYALRDQILDVQVNMCHLPDYAFYGLDKVKTITYVNYPQTYGTACFVGCDSLEAHVSDDTYGGEIRDGVLYGDYNELIHVPAAKTGDLVMYQNCHVIYSYALQGTNLSSVTIPNYMEELGEFVFADNKRELTVTFLGPVPTMNGDSFADTTAAIRYPHLPLMGWSSVVQMNQGGSAAWEGYGPGGICGDDLTWQIDDKGVVTVSGTGPMYDYRDNSPRSIQEATEDSPLDYYMPYLSALVFEEGVTYVGAHAFCQYYDTCHIRDIYLPSSLTAANEQSVYLHEAMYDLHIADWESYSKLLLYLPESGDEDYSEWEEGEIYGWLLDCAVNLYVNGVHITEVEGKPDENGNYNGYDYNYPWIRSIILPETVTAVDGYAFSSNYNMMLQQITFLGDAPSFNENAFGEASLIAYYPKDNATWTADVMQQYGGQVTWAEAGTEVTIDGTCGENLIWRYAPGTGKLTISGQGAMEDYDPFGDLGEATYAPWDAYRLTIQEVVIEEGVESIGFGAFAEYTDLESLYLPASLQEIGEDAFYNVGSIGSVHLADLGSWCMVYLEMETSTPIPLADKIYVNGAALGDTLEIPMGVQYLDVGVFYGLKGVKNVYIPESVEYIGASAFWDCPDLESVEIASLYTELMEWVFAECGRLRCIRFAGEAPYLSPESLLGLNVTVQYPNVPELEWETCMDMTQNYGAESITWEAVDPSGKCGSDLTWSFDTAAGALTISGQGKMYDYAEPAEPPAEGAGDPVILPAWAVYDESVKTVTLEDGVTSAGDLAFADLKNLTEVTLGKDIASLGSRAFEGCGSLAKITFQGPAPQIGETCFTGVAAEACYSVMEAGWTQEVLTNYGGELTWTPYGQVALEIRKQPENASVLAGESACFQVEAVGMGVKYQWLYRTGESGAWKNATASGNQTPALTVPGSFSRNGYQYCCRVTDDEGSELITDAVTLTVTGIKTHPEDASLEIGESVVFTVEATGKALTYQWQYRKNSEAAWSKTTLAGNQTAQLTVKATSGRNGYQYRCLVTDGDGYVMQSNAATLSIRGITSQIEDVNILAGEQAVFSVSAVGSDLSYQWQYRTSDTASWKSATAQGNQTAQLTVPGTLGRSGYQYRCRVTDGEGNWVYSNEATLYVLGIRTQPETVDTVTGAQAEFAVRATGRDLSYQWQYRAGENGTWKRATATGNQTAVLTVPGTTGRNGYFYRCRITDGDGNVIFSEEVNLYVLGITAQPEDVSGNTGGTVTFQVSAVGSALRYQWQYKTSEIGTWKNATAAGNTTSQLTVPATASRSGYFYRCVVANENGDEVVSETASLLLLCVRTQPTAAEAAVGETAEFTVKALGKDLSYQWQYKTSETGTWKAATATGNKTDTLIVPVTNSRNGYFYRCRITDGDGNVIFSDGVTLTVK